MRRHVKGLIPLLLGLLPLALAWGEPAVEAVDSVGITVSDLDRAIEFYTGTLDFTAEPEREVAGEDYEHLFGVFGLRLRVARLTLGDERIELMQFLAPQGRPIPVDSRSNDRWFQHVAIIVSDMDRAYRHLRQRRVEHASPGPQRLPDWNPNAGGIEAFYFRDPDDNHLEILEFPAGKGDAKWHRPTDRLFLGIDHTAIVVADSESSLAFYRDLLGLTVAGTSENYGPEQERLNNVFGARLQITGLRTARGPGIEFLEYVTPRDGRAMPADTRAVDLWHWQVNLQTGDAGALERAVRRGGYALVSPGVIELADGALGFRRGLLLRDPDGHASMLIERR